MRDAVRFWFGSAVALAAVWFGLWLARLALDSFGWLLPWLFFGGAFAGIAYGLAAAWNWAMRPQA